jgi:cob(I)alamin adenosyltransferase
MSDLPAKSDLLSTHGELLDRAKRITASGDADRATEATRILNQLAEAFAWLGGAPTTAALGSARSLLSQAEERLRQLESRRASGATKAAGRS